MSTPITAILFLDFDGVLHPFTRGTFTKLPLFTQWLRSNPHVGVVISSTWRYQHPIEELREFFDLEVRAQILDSTPNLSNSEGLLVLAPSRSEEITAWLTQNPQYAKWAALDDEPGIFKEKRNVVFTEASEALNANHLESIAKLLS